LRRDVGERAEALIRSIAEVCRALPGEDYDRTNKRVMEEFLARVQREFPGRSIALRQPIPAFERRTTDANYIFTVAGQSAEELVLVAHYDTWRGPGADDNTTGEEVLKQYLLEDLRRQPPPPLTHTYVLAGSEECGTIGFLSQCLLTAGLVAANMAWSSGNLTAALISLVAIPMSKYRFGVTGSRFYVQSLSPERLARTKAVLAIDSVGEGRIYILRESLGPDFIRAFIPFEGYQRLDDLLEEAAHLHGIKFNSFLSGGTTDHVSWLEVNNSLLDRLVERLTRKRKPKIPAGALIAMCPGKASPVVFGGKLHTPNDTPDRIYRQPLEETLQIVDYFFHMMQGGARPAEPRSPGDCHYARLYQCDGRMLLALKDVIEYNRRNINMLYRVEGQVSKSGPDVAARLRIKEVAAWGVQTSLDEQIAALLEPEKSWKRVYVTEIHLENGPTFLRRFGAVRSLRAAWYALIGRFEEVMGRYSFAVFFLTAWLVAQLFNLAMNAAFREWNTLAMVFFRVAWATIPATVLVEFAFILYLFAIRLPAAMDNSYKHLNRADNMLSLKRATPKHTPGQAAQKEK
jgi:hypothetical protein